MASPICSSSRPGPGAWLMLPAGTLAPRSLRRSKLLVPNTKLLLLAKEKKEREREREGGGMGKYRAKREGKTPFRRHFSNSEQSGRPGLGNGAGQNVRLQFSYDVPTSLRNKTSGHLTQPWSLLGQCHLETRAMAIYSKCVPFGKNNPFALEPGHTRGSNSSTGPFTFAGLS